MKNRRDALSQARKLLAEARGILGPRAVQGIVEEMLPFIDHLRGVGASWDQIADLLSEAGLRSRKSENVSADSLRASVSRAHRQAGRQSTSAATQPRPVPQSSMINIGIPLQREIQSPGGEPASESGTRVIRRKPGNTSSKTDRLQARMKRAAAMRGSIPDPDE